MTTKHPTQFNHDSRFARMYIFLPVVLFLVPFVTIICLMLAIVQPKNARDTFEDWLHFACDVIDAFPHVWNGTRESVVLDWDDDGYYMDGQGGILC